MHKQNGDQDGISWEKYIRVHKLLHVTSSSVEICAHLMAYYRVCAIQYQNCAWVFVRERDLRVPTVNPWRFGLFCLSPAALQRDTDLPEVLCPLPVSANVLGALRSLTRCNVFLFRQLIHRRIPVFLELWHLAPNLSFLLPSKQWHRDSIACETGRIFFSRSSVPSCAAIRVFWRHFRLTRLLFQRCIGIASLQSMELFHWVTYSAGWERSSQYGHNNRPDFVFFKCTKFPIDFSVKGNGDIRPNALCLNIILPYVFDLYF